MMDTIWAVLDYIALTVILVAAACAVATFAAPIVVGWSTQGVLMV